MTITSDELLTLLDAWRRRGEEYAKLEQPNATIAISACIVDLRALMIDGYRKNNGGVQ